MRPKLQLQIGAAPRFPVVQLAETQGLSAGDPNISEQHVNVSMTSSEDGVASHPNTLINMDMVKAKVEIQVLSKTTHSGNKPEVLKAHISKGSASSPFSATDFLEIAEFGHIYISEVSGASLIPWT